MSSELHDPFAHLHALLKKGDFDAVLDELFDATAGQIRAPYHSDQNHAWYIVGDVFFQKRNWMAAKDAFKRAIQEQSDDVDAYLALANTYIELRDFGSVKDALLVAQRLEPTNSAVLYNLGNAYFDLGEYEKAKFFYASVTPDRDRELWKKAQKNYELSIRRMSERDNNS